MAHPGSKEELLAWIDRDWRAYTAWLDAIDPARVEVAGPFGWSVKDVVANIAAWERGAGALLRRQSRYAAMGITDLAAGASVDQINAVLFEQTRHQTFTRTWAEAETAHAELRTLLDRVSWDHLTMPVSRYHPAMTVTNDSTVLAYVAGDTYEHYAEHRPDIDAIVAAVVAAEEEGAQ